jgi:hypothetical protein
MTFMWKYLFSILWLLETQQFIHLPFHKVRSNIFDPFNFVSHGIEEKFFKNLFLKILCL